MTTTKYDHDVGQNNNSVREQVIPAVRPGTDEEVQSGMADRLVSMTEKEGEHRWARENGASEFRLRGQWMMFCLALISLLGGIFLVILGHQILGAVLALSPLVLGIASRLNRRAREKDASEFRSRGQWMVFCLALMSLFGCIYLVVQGHQIFGATLGFSSLLLGIASRLIGYRRSSRSMPSQQGS